MAPVLKTGRAQALVGSNPTLSAMPPISLFFAGTEVYLALSLQTGIRSTVLLFCGCLLFHLAGTWQIPLLERAEPRYAEASREMRERGDYIIPFFNNAYRFDKPPLAYWAQVASYRIFGENDFAARFPSAIAAALTSVLLLLWGKRCANTRGGWWAALIFALALQVVIYAKAAIADMWLVFFITAAHYAAYRLIEDSLGQKPLPDEKEARFFRGLFYLALVGGFLAKGPIGWTPLLTLGVIKFFSPRVPFAARFKFAPGIFCVLLLVSGWVVPALMRTHGDYVRVAIGQQIIDRSVTPIKGQGAQSFVGYIATLPFYFVTIFFSFFPWSIKFPSLTARLWRKRDPLEDFLLAGAAIFFLIFTFFKTKLPHYTMPALPLLSLLLARQLEQSPNGTAFVRRSAVVVTVGYLIVALVLPPFSKGLFPTVQLLEKVRDDLKPEMEFGAVDYVEPSLVWYFRRYIKGWMTKLDAENVVAFMAKPGARFVILPTPLARSAFAQTPNEWKKYSIETVYPVKGRSIALSLILKPE